MANLYDIHKKNPYSLHDFIFVKIAAFKHFSKATYENVGCVLVVTKIQWVSVFCLEKSLEQIYFCIDIISLMA